MTEHTEEGRSVQQENKGYFGKEKHKPWKRLNRRLRQLNGKQKHNTGKKQMFLICPILQHWSKDTPTSLFNTKQHTGSSALAFIKAQ